MNWIEVIDQIQKKYFDETGKQCGYRIIADAVGVSATHIYFLHKGKRKNPNYDLAQKLLKLQKGGICKKQHTKAS